MMKVKKIGIAFLFILIVLTIITTVNAASDFDLKKLEFDVKLNENGSMDVVETWNIKVDGTTNTLFKTFNLDKSKFDGISNTKIVEVLQNGETIAFEETHTWVNHAKTNEFFALKNSKGEFEIAWGINVSSGNKVYKMSYTVDNVISVYNDISELYWQFIGSGDNVPADEVIGRITLPKSVELKENLRVWAHGPLNGNIEITSNNTVSFSVKPYTAETFLEVRIGVLETGMFTAATRVIPQNKLDSIIEEETNWANKANAERERIKNTKRNMTIAGFGIAVIGAVIFAILSIKHKKILEGLSKMEPTVKYDYFREIPDKNSTPAEVAFLYYLRKVGMQTVMPRILSGTMLDLALKKYIEFEIKDAKNITIRLTGNSQEELKESEREIFELLKSVAQGASEFNIKDMEKYAKKHNTKFLKALEKVEKKAKEEQIRNGNYDLNSEKKYNNWSTGARSNYSCSNFCINNNSGYCTKLYSNCNIPNSGNYRHIYLFGNCRKIFRSYTKRFR